MRAGRIWRQISLIGKLPIYSSNKAASGMNEKRYQIDDMHWPLLVIFICLGVLFTALVFFIGTLV